MHFLGLSFEFGPRCLTDRALVLASGYRVRTPLKPNFPNLPFCEVFRAETVKKGRFEKFVFPNYHIPGAFSLERRPFIWVLAPWPNGSGVGPGQRVQGSNRTQFLNPTIFWGFQGWNFQKEVGLRNFLPPVSQTYPFLRFSVLKAPKRGSFEKSSPASFFQKGVGWTLKKDWFEKSSSASFFNTLHRMSIWPSQISGIRIPTSANIFLFQRLNSYFSFELTKFDLTTCEL